jgi:lipoic acid synthetase
VLRENGLTTVCREARCPNIGQCWSQNTATLMLLGDRCTRRCSFCAVSTEWPAGAVDATEPERVARAVREWGLKYVVLTMVARDDLGDHGAGIVAETTRALRQECPGILVEVLTSDLGGSPDALRTVLASHPHVFAHNVETIRRLTPEARDSRATYETSLRVLQRAKTMTDIPLVTKSSLMLGLGEEMEEVVEALGDLRRASVDIVTLGQYLKPGGEGYHPVARYPPPSEFAELGRVARSLGFKGVASGPMVRSSYMAEELYRASVTRG